MSPPPADPYLGRMIAGRYKLEQRLGEGGMGVVYRARHVVIDRVVALKLIRPDLRSERHLRDWLLREARAANRVDHAHIIDIYDIGETEEGEVYLVMEYIVGVPLSVEVAKGPMQLRRCVDIVEQIVAALGRAHDLGVIHRDLKADNLLLTTRQGRKDFVKILDFGLAHLLTDPRLAPKGAVFGTPEYMSPEQAMGEDPTAQSDLYALGVLFYEMLTGELPFRSADSEQVLEMQRTKAPPSPRKKRPDLPVQAETLVLKLMAKSCAERYEDAHHLSEDLRVLQRELPAPSWELPGEVPAAAPATGGRGWSARVAQVAQIVTQAYAGGEPPPAVARALDQVWSTARQASQLEADVSTHVARLEALERQSRSLRAEIGRRVEELAREESRLKRDASNDVEEIERLRVRLAIAEEAVAGARGNVEALEEQPEQPPAKVMNAFERLGAAVAAHEARREALDEREDRAKKRDQQLAELREQIDKQRAQLAEASEGVEHELAREHERVGQRSEDERSLQRKFRDACGILHRQLQQRPVADALAEELAAAAGLENRTPTAVEAVQPRKGPARA